MGLTGGIGSGKSLAGDFFAQLGGQVLDADDLARKVIERGTPGFDAVLSRFGDGILKNGDIDRRALAEIIFGSDQLKRELESIIHPLVKFAFESATANLETDALVIYEVPLIVEAQVHDRFDYIVTVEAQIENRLERLQGRGFTASESNARIAAQASSAQRRAVADYVIENDGTPDELFAAVEHLWIEVLPKIAHRKR